MAKVRERLGFGTACYGADIRAGLCAESRARSVFRIVAASCAAVAFLSVTGCSSVRARASAPRSVGVRRTSALFFTSSAAIWFHPLPTVKDWPGGDIDGAGSTDFLELFKPSAPWANAAARTKVLGLYAGWIAAVSDQVLQQAVEFANARDMGIEIEAPALQAPASCGSGVEGYVPRGHSLRDFTLSYLGRLKALGARVPFIKVDEPFYFGSVANGPNTCHWSMSKVASEVAKYVQLVKSVYPEAAVGDVEPIIASAYLPGVVTAIGRWHDAYQDANGAPFPFFFADIDFRNESWPLIVKALEARTKARGMQFGIIYIGDVSDASDEEWADKVVARFRTYQGERGGQPDYVLFQSWELHPQNCLPESNPNTLTGVLDAYVSATTARDGSNP